MDRFRCETVLGLLEELQGNLFRGQTRSKIRAHIASSLAKEVMICLFTALELRLQDMVVFGGSHCQGPNHPALKLQV